jgi:ankyrin repeat protein
MTEVEAAEIFFLSLDKAEIERAKGAGFSIDDYYPSPYREYRKYTPLRWAVERGTAEQLHLLASCGADVKGEDENHCLIRLAVSAKRPKEVITALVEIGADINRSNGYITPLTDAVQQKDTKLVSTLLCLGADVNVPAREFRSLPLSRAVENEHIRMIDQLITAGASLDIQIEEAGYSDSFLHLAAMGKNYAYEISRMLLASGAPYQIDGAGWYPIHMAIRYDNTELVRFYIKLIREQGKHHLPINLLTMASRAGNLAMVEMLLELEVPRFTASGAENALHAACHSHRPLIITTLLEAGVSYQMDERGILPGELLDPKDENYDLCVERLQAHIKPIFALALSGKKRETTEAIKKQADLGLRDQMGKSILHVVCKTGHTQAVKMLIKRMDEIDDGDALGNTPLHYAVIAGHQKICQLLLEAGASAQVRNHQGMSPSMLKLKEQKPELFAR